MNLNNPQEKSNDLAGPSEIGEGNQLMVPVSYQPDDGQQTGHTIPISEPRFCRVCVDEEEDGDAGDLVELRCNCKGQMSRMHRNCILKWYGLRMILDNRFKCELCNTTLHPATQLVVEQAVTDHENQGRHVLLKALATELAPYGPHVDLENAATYHELVDLIHHTNPRRYVMRQILVNARGPAHLSGNDEPQQLGRRSSPAACNQVIGFVVLSAAGIAAVLYFILVIVYYGKTAFH